MLAPVSTERVTALDMEGSDVEDVLVNAEALREQVRDKYREVATDPHRSFHFHTGRPLTARLG